ncbi:unnamed protein product [Clonostachys rosea]|uniref:Heterokaryon incompatibility domain-containing protein n=1 Tax=Bionectria ochroleuca TaxID=29856 RepID=A0ABY6UY41_BIOOC|nr:unnamed protein product [Clonostachys rosea]
MAECVYVWLCNGDTASDQALEFLKKQSRLSTRLPLSILRSKTDGEYVDSLRRYRDASWSDMFFRFSLSPLWTKKVDLDVILRSQWLFRCWTFQEFLLARNMIFICGNEYISWEDLSSAVCLDPTDSYLVRSQPINKDTREHWLSLSNLWFNLPRRELGLYSPAPGRASVDSFQAGINRAWSQSRNKPTRGLWNANACSSVVIGAGLVALYSAMWENAEHILGPLGRSVPWWFISAAFLSLSMNFMVFWWQLVLGLEPKWATTENTDKDIRARVIDGVRWALKNRDCSNPHDKSFSLQGVLNICQVVQQKPDYARPVADTYRILMEDLISWDPQSLIMLLDAGLRLSSAPSWVPNWTGSGPSEWLASQYRTGKAPTAAFLRPYSAIPVVNNGILRLNGVTIGTIKFRTDMTMPGTSQRDQQLSTLFRLAQYLAQINTESFRPLLPEDLIGTSFAVLEGLIRKEGPRYKKSNNLIHTKTRLTAWEGPYDFSKERTQFLRLKALRDLIMSSLPRLDLESEEKSRVVITELLHKVLKSGYMSNYFLRLVDILNTQRRSLYVLSSGLAGTGPLGVSVGDEVFLIPGVPAPMVLRRGDKADGMTVIGATLVHGMMHGEKTLAITYTMVNLC